MRSDLDRLTREGDARRFFHGTYLRTTEAVAQEVECGGFIDGEWVLAWDLAFATCYLDALDADLRGQPVSRPWRVAFDAARDQPELPPLRHVLFGINAHINYDLPQAIVAVMTPGDFDAPEVVGRRRADHQHLDDVLSSRVPAEDAELTAVSRLTVVDRLLRPANRAATKRFLAEARGKVWRNAIVLDRARRIGMDRYATVLADLERRSAARLTDLTAPGLVLLRLALRGFGVLLPAPAISGSAAHLVSEREQGHRHELEVRDPERNADDGDELGDRRGQVTER
jgi:hypothetical protein